MQTMEGTLERKQKLQLGGKKVRRGSTRCWEKPARSANAKPLSQQHTLTTRSYLIFTGSLQRLELLPRRLTQAHLVLLPGQKGYTEGEQHKSGLSKKQKAEENRDDDDNVVFAGEVGDDQPVLCCRAQRVACR